MKIGIGRVRGQGLCAFWSADIILGYVEAGLLRSDESDVKE